MRRQYVRDGDGGTLEAPTLRQLPIGTKVFVDVSNKGWVEAEVRSLLPASEGGFRACINGDESFVKRKGRGGMEEEEGSGEDGAQ